MPSVPAGTYYLSFNTPDVAFDSTQQQVPVLDVQLIALTADAPDLSTVVHGRADGVAQTSSSQVDLSVSGLDPWTPRPYFARDRVFVLTAQAGTNADATLDIFPASNSTSAELVFDWGLNVFDGTGWLPDAAKGDTTWFYQRHTVALQNGGKAAVATRFFKSTDFTVHDGTGAKVSVALQAAPLSSTIPTAARLSQFAALVPAMNPAATVLYDFQNPLLFGSQAGVSVLSYPGSLTFPDMQADLTVGRAASPAGHAAFFTYDDGSSLNGLTVDTDFGTLSYGGFFDAAFHDLRSFYYSSTVLADTYGPNGSNAMFPAYAAREAVSAGLPAAITPRLSPVTAPLINGLDAFQRQQGVGPTPTLSWSPPLLGTPTSYAVSIQLLSYPDPSNSISLVTVNVGTATSFTVPPGLLQTGKTYAAYLTAIEAPWQDQNRPYRCGLPWYSIDAATNPFTP